MAASAAYVSVDEASRRLRLSAASIRRRCASGDLAAQKVGRSWLIEETTLGRRRAYGANGRRHVPALVDLELGLPHLLRQDLRKDVWVPDILFFEDELAAREDLFELTNAKISLVADFDPAIKVQVPKSPLFVRQGADLSVSMV